VSELGWFRSDPRRRGSIRAVKHFGKFILKNPVAVAEGILAGTAFAAGVLGLLGWLPLKSERAAQAVLALGGLITLAFVVEAGERRRVMRGLTDTHKALLELRGAAPLRELEANKIAGTLQELLDKSTGWSFRGGSARYLRRTTLPTLAREKGQEVPVFIALLDPRDLDLCDAYANYRQKIGRRDPEVSARSIQAEILGTIYLAGWYAVRTRIDPKVVLLRSFSQLRYDVGSAGLVVTVADTSQPGLFAEAETWYYKSLRDELAQTVHGNPTVALPAVETYFPQTIAEVTEQNVREALAATTADGEALLDLAAEAGKLEFTAVRVAVITPHEPND
jgi:hypothetical protein